jgi:siroheme synthase (precorrin-2 oxidase/ferrochelatase)
LNNQVELLQEQIDQVRERESGGRFFSSKCFLLINLFLNRKKVKTDIRQFEKQGIEMEEQRKRILRELEQKYQNATHLAEDYEEKIKANKKILDQSRVGAYRSLSTAFLHQLV